MFRTKARAKTWIKSQGPDAFKKDVHVNYKGAWTVHEGDARIGHVRVTPSCVYFFDTRKKLQKYKLLSRPYLGALVGPARKRIVLRDAARPQVIRYWTPKWTDDETITWAPEYDVDFDEPEPEWVQRDEDYARRIVWKRPK